MHFARTRTKLCATSSECEGLHVPCRAHVDLHVAENLERLERLQLSKSFKSGGRRWRSSRNHNGEVRKHAPQCIFLRVMHVGHCGVCSRDAPLDRVQGHAKRRTSNVTVRTVTFHVRLANALLFKRDDGGYYIMMQRDCEISVNADNGEWRPGLFTSFKGMDSSTVRCTSHVQSDREEPTTVTCGYRME